jgi:hypothetical protein
VEDVEKENPQLHRLIELGKYAHQQLQAVGHAQGEMVRLANKGCRRQCFSLLMCCKQTLCDVLCTRHSEMLRQTDYPRPDHHMRFARVCAFQRVLKMKESRCCARKRQSGECSGRDER